MHPYNSSTVQQYHSLFIKEGLKMKVKQNLKVEENMIKEIIKEPKKEPEVEELTAEDEERRRRRRERNKVAATKCRNKKKEKTCLLVTEGESLETQNYNLKQEITRLEAEKRHLVEILSLHEPSCAKRARRCTELPPTSDPTAAASPKSTNRGGGGGGQLKEDKPVVELGVDDESR